MQTLSLDLFASPCNLPSNFNKAQPLNEALQTHGQLLVDDIFPFERVAQLLQTPSWFAPKEVRDAWKDVIIPSQDNGEDLIIGGKGGIELSTSMNPRVCTQSRFAITALGLNFIQAVRTETTSPEKLQKLYEAFIFWKAFDLREWNMPFVFRPETENARMEDFAMMMTVER